ncbi:hypothetical protein GCM10009839_21350 [Catenulispora yoronensis]|uniref:Uncharacterized protein n=1 Tax=Catenulispora yoronensis TaxID=450799 RepID=A0ABN2TW69_9ACTN
MLFPLLSNNEAYISNPFCTAERDARKKILDLLELMNETRKRQQRLSLNHQLPWTPPRPGSKAGIAPNVGTDLWPINGLRLPAKNSTLDRARLRRYPQGSDPARDLINWHCGNRARRGRPRMGRALMA